MVSGLGGSEFISGGGEAGAILRRIVWERHPLGPPQAWAQALRTSIRILLTTRHPVLIFWGPSFFAFYNDAFTKLVGPEKHPAMMAASGKEFWGEVWSSVGADLESILRGGPAVWQEDRLVPIERNGLLDEAYWTYSHSPIDQEGQVGGVLVLCVETTRSVLEARHAAEERRRQQRLFEQAPGFIIVMRGPLHTVEFVNDAHKAVFNSGDWIGKPIREAFPSIAGQGYFEQLDQVFERGKTYEATAAEVRYRRQRDLPDESRFLTFIYAALHDAQGCISGVFCEGFDVTSAHLAQRRSAALAEIGEMIRQTENPDEIAYEAAKALGLALDVSRAGYGTINTQLETIEIERDWNASGVRSPSRRTAVPRLWNLPSMI